MDIQKIRIDEITDVFYLYSKKGVKEEMVNRKNYGISFGESGRITYVQDGVKTVSTAHNVILLPKGGNYKIIRQETGFFTVINFDCSEDIGDRIACFDIGSNQKILELFFELKESFIKNDTFGSLAVLYRILSEIFEFTPNDTFSQIQKYIDDSLFDATLSNKKIADAIHISESYLNKLFIKQCGISTKKYIIRKRIELATKYLGENRYSIGQICEKCGYSNLYSFSRAFKSIKNVSPLEYKKTMQNR